jgi:hypothetical protein
LAVVSAALAHYEAATFDEVAQHERPLIGQRELLMACQNDHLAAGDLLTEVHGAGVDAFVRRGVVDGVAEVLHAVGVDDAALPVHLQRHDADANGRRRTRAACLPGPQVDLVGAGVVRVARVCYRRLIAGYQHTPKLQIGRVRQIASLLQAVCVQHEAG